MEESVKPPPGLKKRVLSTKQKTTPNFLVGAAGEKRAEQFLLQLGYTILNTNLVYKRWEVDIVAHDVLHNELIFVEVKTRKNGQFGHASQAVTKQKMGRMKRVAQKTLSKLRWQGTYRFDVITVTAGTIEHYRNVSWP